jgi:hypothetical protein
MSIDSDNDEENLSRNSRTSSPSRLARPFHPQQLGRPAGHELGERNRQEEAGDGRPLDGSVFANAGALGVADGYEVYFLTDASSGASREAHDMAVQRVIEGGDPDSDRVLCQRIAA